jgi:1,4-alpha-glucan branching enzyme
VRNPGSYPWHDPGFLPPAIQDLTIYQLHVGAFYIPPGRREGKFLDVLAKLEYLASLGVNAIQLLPVVEFWTKFSMGYNGVDLFSPEGLYASYDDLELKDYLATVNDLLERKGRTGLTLDQLRPAVNQLKALIDVCHVYGLAVILDVVYNHAGGGFGDESLYFLDNALPGNDNDSLYFTDQGWAGGLVFAFWKQEVRQFLIDNARLFLEEYHADGFRYDEVSVIVRSSDDGWRFCQDLTRTVRSLRPADIQIAEHWPVDPRVVEDVGEGGAGFDATWNDGVRDSVRAALGQAAGGRDIWVDLDRVAANLRLGLGFPAAWSAVQYLESHDEVYGGRSPRIPALCDPSNGRSWYARSRARVASGLLLTAPGIPMLFMGQEFLEDKQWSDAVADAPGSLICWDGLARGDKAMVDHLRFTQELTALRRRQPAPRGEAINVFHVHDVNRILAFHRWLEGTGRDLVVVASLRESSFFDYELGFPLPGRWLEIFNSDVYDNWVNPQVTGNGGSIVADGAGLHGLPHSARIVIPANSLLVFARDTGD